MPFGPWLRGLSRAALSSPGPHEQLVQGVRFHRGPLPSLLRTMTTHRLPDWHWQPGFDCRRLGNKGRQVFPDAPLARHQPFRVRRLGAPCKPPGHPGQGGQFSTPIWPTSNDAFSQSLSDHNGRSLTVFHFGHLWRRFCQAGFPVQEYAAEVCAHILVAVGVGRSAPSQPSLGWSVRLLPPIP